MSYTDEINRTKRDIKKIQAYIDTIENRYVNHVELTLKHRKQIIDLQAYLKLLS